MLTNPLVDEITRNPAWFTGSFSFVDKGYRTTQVLMFGKHADSILAKS